MGWFSNLGAAPPPQAPLRPLTLPRLVNTLLNQFALRGFPANNQKDPYIFGDGTIIPIKGGFPIWVYCEYNTLGALKTGRVRIPMPDDFRLLSYFGSASVNTKGGFRVNVYDVNRRLRLTDRPVNLQTLAGTGSSPLYQGGFTGSRQAAPYAFQKSNSQVLITIVNLEPNPNQIQFGMYGIQGGKSI
ncbi:MAG: hypothetical protein LAO08_20075 [Acidobacteriia bacterium]|nr:hypothetical protein [Terriglobia bacterium]